MNCVTDILFQTNMPESRQNNARHQLTNWSATFMQWTWEKPQQWTGNRRFFTSPPTSFPGFSPNRPYLSNSVGTVRRELWERGCFSPCLAHWPKCRFDLAWLIKHLLSGLILRAIQISTKKNIISLRVWPLPPLTSQGIIEVKVCEFIAQRRGAT